VDYDKANLYLAKGEYAAARSLLEPLSERGELSEGFRADVNLSLLYVYSKTDNHDRARQIYSHIMSQKSINNSHSKAKEIFQG
jgi:outer membrane protein assembly factor BamD (BamD/ComL family)